MRRIAPLLFALRKRVSDRPAGFAYRDPIREPRKNAKDMPKGAAARHGCQAVHARSVAFVERTRVATDLDCMASGHGLVEFCATESTSAHTWRAGALI